MAHYLRMRTSYILLAIVSSLVACSQGYSEKTQPTPQTYNHIDYNSQLSVEQLFDYAKVLVESETNTTLDKIELIFVSDEQIQKEVARETRKLVESQFDSSDFSELYLQKILNEQSGTYTALYVSNNNKSVWINRSLLQAYKNSVPENNTVLANKSLLALLLHELAHAADDQLYDIHKKRILNFKSSFIQSAAFEGHAQLVTRNICKKHTCLEGMDSLENFMFDTIPSTDPVAHNVQAISRNVLEYSYLEGERFLTELQSRPDGDQLIQQVLTDPPDDPIQILVPESFPDLARERRNQLLETALRTAAHPWNTSRWSIVETSTIKGIDLRNDPERRDAAVQGFTQLIDSMTAAQVFDQESYKIKPIDLMLIHAENEQTAVMFAESFVKSTASVIESLNLEVDIELSNSGMGTRVIATSAGVSDEQIPYTEILVRSTQFKDNDDNYAALIGVAGKYVIQISGDFPKDMPEARTYSKAAIESLLSPN